VRIVSRIGFALAFMLAMAWAAETRADSPTTVSCDGFVLGFSGQVDKKTCSTEDLTHGRSVGSLRRIEIHDQQFYMTVSYYQSKFMGYYAYRSLRDLIDQNGAISKITAWRPLADSGGFNIAAFGAVKASDNKTIVCAIFSRYSGAKSGPYEFPDGPGYKNMLEGLYCPRGGFASTAAGSEPMTALQDAIGKIQLPAE
jgi:hypothetical protein